MPTQVFEVEPIVAGLDSFIRIQYDESTITELSLKSGSLQIDLRERPHQAGTLVATKTSASGITWEDNTLVVALTMAETAQIKAERVYFDILHTNAGSTYRIPGNWEWPVERAITVPNA